MRLCMACHAASAAATRPQPTGRLQPDPGTRHSVGARYGPGAAGGVPHPGA